MLLTATNTYQGMTVIENGRLVVSGNGSIATSGGVSVSSGAYFDVAGVTTAPYALGAAQTLSGRGTIHGAISVAGQVTPGPDYPTSLTFDSNLTLASTATVNVDVYAGSTIGDQLLVSSNLTYGGTLAIVNQSGDNITLSDYFVIFPTGTRSGAFTSITPAYPNNNSALSWDTSTLTTDGTLRVMATPAPVAQMTLGATTGMYPLTVNFTNTSIGPVDNGLWEFGDGDSTNNITAVPMVHVYTNAGTYTAILWVTNGTGSSSVTNTIIVTSTVPAPVASFTCGPTNGTAPLSVNFTNTSTGAPLTGLWVFGDGATSTDVVSVPVAHTYTVAGSYSAELWVTNSGGWSSVTNTIVVTPSSIQGNPKITKVTVSGTNVTVIGTNSPLSSGRAYNLLRSNNVAGSRSAWPVVATGSFAADGGFTNVVTGGVSGTRQFFIIQVP